MNEKLINSIVLHQSSIEELKKLKECIDDNTEDNVNFIVETSHMIGYFDVNFIKRKTKVNISNHSMNLILDEAIEKEKDEINKLIDMEVNNRMSKQKTKGGRVWQLELKNRQKKK